MGTRIPPLVLLLYNLVVERHLPCALVAIFQNNRVPCRRWPFPLPKGHGGAALSYLSKALPSDFGESSVGELQGEGKSGRHDR
jgi:hypothetical protein